MMVTPISLLFILIRFFELFISCLHTALQNLSVELSPCTPPSIRSTFFMSTDLQIIIHLQTCHELATGRLRVQWLQGQWCGLCEGLFLLFFACFPPILTALQT